MLVFVSGFAIAGCGGGDDATVDGDANGRADAIPGGDDAALACGALTAACCEQEPLCDDSLTCIGAVCGCAEAIASRGQHTCALRTDGAVWCWGRNHHGQLGIDSIAPRDRPARALLPAATIARDIATGVAHSCALADTGLYCWGYGADGQLGDGSTTDRDVPIPVSLPDGLQASELADITLGGFHSCAITGAGALWCWGDNESGQIGNGEMGVDVHQLEPHHVQLVAAAAQVTAGEDHTCVLLTGGAVWCWGDNSVGQLGDGTTTSRPTPAVVRLEGGGPMINVEGIYAAAFHTCARKTDASLWCWGENTFGQLGSGASSAPRTRPVRAQLDGVVAMAGGERHSCALEDDSILRCWGQNKTGQLGLGDDSPRLDPEPVGALSATAAITAGDIHTCAVADGAIFCWGYNDYGQLGSGSRDTSYEPVEALLPCP